jgi:hypothetical protein
MSATINTKIKITNKKTNEFFYLNDHTNPRDVIALQEFPTFTKDVRANSIILNGRHGAYKLPHFYGGMSIIFSGLILGVDEASVWQNKKKIDRVLMLEETTDYDELIEISFIDVNGLELKIDATMNAETLYKRDLKEPFILHFQIMLRARKHYFVVNDGTTIIFTGDMTGELSTFKIPFKVPFKLTKASGILTNVTSEGTSKTIIKMYGSDDEEIVNPFIENTTTGELTRFVYTIPKGSSNFIELDNINDTAINQDGQSVGIYIDTGAGINLIDGINKLKYSCEKNEDGLYPTASFTVEVKRILI